MSGVRIKDLQSAKPVVEQNFDDFQFVVDAPQPDATLKLSGKELKEAVGMKKHTHPLEEVDGLPGELEKKFDKAGGTITGDLRVDGNARMKNLQIDEYLEVPELKYNRITATGNEFWVTDGGVIDDVAVGDDGVYLLSLKSKEGETTINFQFKDILRGIFYTENEQGNPAGFRTAYLEVTGVIDPIRFYCVPLNGIPPQRFMTLARQGNRNDPHRQGSVYLDGLNKYIRVNDRVTGTDIGTENIRAQLGDLSGIDHPVFGQLHGFGALFDNAYICGRLVQRNPATGEDWVIGAVYVSGQQVIRYNSDNIPEPESITLTATEQGITSPEDAREWQYKNGSEWVTIPGSNSLTLTIAHNSLLWGGRNAITLRYLACGTYYDIITLTKLYDGEDAYQVTILSGNGTNFINGDIATTLRARVYKGGRDITDRLPANAFCWFRVSDNPEGDAVWNELHAAAGQAVAIGDADVYRRAVFSCEVNIS